MTKSKTVSVETIAGAPKFGITRYGDGEIEIELSGHDFHYAFLKEEDFRSALEELGILEKEAGRSDGFYDAVLRWLKAEKYRAPDAVKILNVEQDERSGGYCETCWYEEIVVEISYEDVTGEPGLYTYYGDMGEFVRELAD